jgi:hypothetical protein|eukprot:COSAG02_NODE_9409_length_2226_cov_1.488011_2_plen_92_part_00
MAKGRLRRFITIAITVSYSTTLLCHSRQRICHLDGSPLWDLDGSPFSGETSASTESSMTPGIGLMSGVIRDLAVYELSARCSRYKVIQPYA